MDRENYKAPKLLQASCSVGAPESNIRYTATISADGLTQAFEEAAKIGLDTAALEYTQGQFQKLIENAAKCAVGILADAVRLGTAHGPGTKVSIEHPLVMAQSSRAIVACCVKTPPEKDGK